MSQIENHMVIGDYYRDHIYEPDKCSVCGDEEFDCRDTHMGSLCSSCTRECAICKDWMLDEEGVRDSEGNEAHKICAEEAGQEPTWKPEAAAS